ncbi:MAG TPA: hypothetical protein VFI47_12945 [Acidimicrobiales bacterium]|nr:hypothetical protein [Acidimicrobiales bacterium]
MSDGPDGPGRAGGRDGGGALSTTSWQHPAEHPDASTTRDVVVDMGWGRVLFGQTFRSFEGIVSHLRDEAEGRRDICLYARDPHVLVARAPQELFVDPSYSFRIWLHHALPRHEPTQGVVVRALAGRDDAEAVNRTYVRLLSPLTFDRWDREPKGDLRDFPSGSQPAPVERFGELPEGPVTSSP